MAATHQPRRPARSALLAALLAGMGAASWALDLQQAYDAALEQDASIRASRAAAESGRERLPQARAQLLPSLSASWGRTKNRLETTQPNMLGQLSTRDDTYMSYGKVVSLRQPLFNKQRWAQYRQAEAQVEQAEAVLSDDLQKLAVRVSSAYFDALLADDQLVLIEAQKATYTTQVDAARKALAAGSGTRTDIDDAQSRLDMAIAQELEARQNQDYTRRTLESLINQPAGALAGIDVARMPLLPPDPLQLEDWTRMAEGASAEIKAMKAQLEAARREVEKTQAGHYPTLDASAQWSDSASENITSIHSRYVNKAVGLQLSIPLYAGGYVNSTVRQALAEQERISESLEALRRDLALRVNKEYRGVTEGILRVRALEQAARSADQLVLSTRKSFEAGSRTQVDILNAEQSRMQTLRDLAQARYLYLLSRIRLQTLAGGDREAAIAQVNSWLKH